MTNKTTENKYGLEQVRYFVQMLLKEYGDKREIEVLRDIMMHTTNAGVISHIMERLEVLTPKRPKNV